MVVDDLTRPTPAADVLPLLVADLRRLKSAVAITAFVAGGTHPPDSGDAVVKKVGAQIAATLRVVPHGLSWRAGGSRDLAGGVAGEDQRSFMEKDLKIDRPFYPILVAFGGAKIVLPGLCGAETTRMTIGARTRARRLDHTEVRRDMVAIARRAGLEFIVNVTLNRHRAISGLFAGDAQNKPSNRRAEAARQLYQAASPPRADVVVADMYPFDGSWQLAQDRGLYAGTDRAGTSKVVIAGLPAGRRQP
ncbi:MAG: lactate racemase domain-containing protein [Nitrospiraceae bacterium]